MRISQDVPPAKIFRRHAPELKRGAKTGAGVPVQFQLLGGDPEKLAIAALRACEAGAQSIDLNFGCPAPTVNRHDGGATLLKYPDRIRTIVAAVRSAVPRPIPVSAKLRLGWEDIRDVHLNADRAAEGGASWITIHARTKVQGYRPPAYWGPIGEVRRRLSVPVVANGEIWSLDDFKRCREETGCEHFMLGRGAVANPFLAGQIARELGTASASQVLDWHPIGDSLESWRPWIERFSVLSAAMSPRRGTYGVSGYVVSRLKQWLRMAMVKTPIPWFEQIKTLTSLDEVLGFTRGRSADAMAGASLPHSAMATPSVRGSGTP